MNPIRNLYDSLPVRVRNQIRSSLPDQFLRWYAHKNTDVYLLSYPKCGRTWLRLMIGKVIVQHFMLPEDEDILFLRDRQKLPPAVPRITVVHDDRPMLKSPDKLKATKTRYGDKKLIFLVRDPRDVIVSSFFEMKNRAYIFGDNPYETRRAIFEGSLSEFINREEGGFDTILRYYNIWAANRHIPKDFLLVRYEDINANPHNELRRVVNFLGLQVVSDEVIANAVKYASFDNMHRMEANQKFHTSILKPADKADINSYKTRKGKVRGFTDNLTKDEIEALNRKLDEQLTDYYGYKP